MQLGTRTPGSPAPTNEDAHATPPPVIDSTAIGWSVAGTMNAPKNASLAVLYPPNARDVHSPRLQKAKPPHSSTISNPPPPHASILPPFPRQGTAPPNPPINLPPIFNTTPQPVDSSRIQDADLLLNLTHSPYSQSSPQQLPNPGLPPPPSHLTNPQQQHQSVYLEHAQQQQQQQKQQQQQHKILYQATLSQQQQQQQEYQRMQEQGGMNYNNMMIESQDMDLSALGDDMMWLEYLPSEPLGGFYNGGHGV